MMTIVNNTPSSPRQKSGTEAVRPEKDWPASQIPATATETQRAGPTFRLDAIHSHSITTANKTKCPKLKTAVTCRPQDIGGIGTNSSTPNRPAMGRVEPAYQNDLRRPFPFSLEIKVLCFLLRGPKFLEPFLGPDAPQ